MVKVLSASLQMVAGTIDMEGHQIKDVADGTDPQDVGTKAQVDLAGAPTGFTEIELYLANRQAQIQFTDGPTDAGSVAAPGPINVKVGVTDGDGVVVPWPLDVAEEVTVTLFSNTTGQTIRINGTPIGAGYVVDLSAANEVTIAVDQAAPGAGTVVLALSDSGATGLDVSDQFTITFT